MKKALFFPLQVSLCTVGCLYASSGITHAQVTSDGTVNTQVNQDGNSAVITGGETRGGNLFHSFQDFSVPTGNEAFFNNADSISNIFSRVTGGNISNIDGLIRANGSASLFLINPAGIIFGENARLDIGGSFYGSSASSILFEDGEFSAADLENPPLLTVNAPIGLGFRDEPGDIENNSIVNDGRGLEVNIGNNISLLGGDIRFSSGNITAPGGVINLGGLTTEGAITFADNGSFSFPEEITKSNISIANSSTVSVLSNTNGSIFVDSEIFEVTSGSSLIAGINSSSTEVEAQAGNILINANDSISLSDADIFNQVESNAIGNSGDIEINTSNINLSGESRISSSIFGQGDAGNVVVDASESISLSESSDIFAVVFDSGIGNGGDINITTSELSLSGDNSLFSVSTLGQGDAGSLNIDASDSVSVSDSSAILAIVTNSGIGNAGEINISTTNLFLTNGGQISSSTFGTGDSGLISIDTTESVSINGRTPDGEFNSGILSTVGTNATGNAGKIEINTNNLSLTNSGLINASTFGEGNGGEIFLNSNEVSLDSGRIFNRVNENAQGNAGLIQIETNNLSLADNSRIDVGTMNQGNGGELIINASGQVNLNNSDIFNPVGTNATGNAGRVEVNTNNLALVNNAQIDVSTFGTGKGGNLVINVNDSISLDNSDIFNRVRGEAIGNGGQIDINTNNLSLTDNSRIDVGTIGQGNGGELTINSGGLVTLDDSDIFNQVGSDGTGNAGQVNISTNNLSLTNGSQINSGTFGTGNSGLISIDATESISIDGRTPDGEFSSGVLSTVGTNGRGNSNGITITSNNLTISASGIITASVFGQGNTGQININTTDSISLDNGNILSEIQEGAIGNSENINIVTSNLSLTSSSDISTRIFSFDNPEIVKAGNINIDTNNLELTFSGQIDSGIAESGVGIGGDIIINADDIFIQSPSINGFTGIVSNVIGDAQGDAGSITINTRLLKTSGTVAEISASNRSQGNAGELNINATESISITNGGFFADIFSSSASGNAGNLTINSPELDVSGTGEISIENLGDGNGGSLNIDVDNLRLTNSRILGSASGEGNGADINIKSNESITLDNSGIFSLVQQGAIGNGGEIQISTENLLITNDGAISSSTLGQGNAGDIDIDARDIVINEPVKDEQFVSGIFNLVGENGTGNGGQIEIFTTTLSISDGGLIDASNLGQGNAGNIDINAQDNVILNDGTIFATNEPISPNDATTGGNITLKIEENLILRNDSFISATALSNADGGNLSIDANFVIAFPDGNNDIIASAEQGQGGNITINAESLFGIQERTPSDLTNDINASSQVSGLDGIISISTPDINPIQGATELPSNVVEPGETTEQACQANREALAKGGLNIVGKGGIVPDPALPLNSLNVIANGENTPTSTIPAPIETAQGKIQPARGVKITESGEVILTAYRTNNSGDRLPEKRNCG